MDKWSKMRNVITVARPRRDEDVLPRALERERRDAGNPTEPRPERPSYGPPHGMSDPGYHGGYQSGNFTSPPPQNYYGSSQYNPNSNAQDYSSPPPAGSYPPQNSSYGPSHGNYQSSDPSSYRPSHNDHSGHQGYAPQSALPDEQHQQRPQIFQGYPTNQLPYSQNGGASSSSMDWYGQTQHHNQNSPPPVPPRTNDIGTSYNSGYNGGRPTRTSSAPAVCEHGLLYDR